MKGKIKKLREDLNNDAYFKTVYKYTFDANLEGKHLNFDVAK